MPGRSPPLYCTLTLIAMKGHQTKAKTKQKICSTSSNMVVIIYFVVMCVAVRRTLFEFDTRRFMMHHETEGTILESSTTHTHTTAARVRHAHIITRPQGATTKRQP